MPDYRPTSLNRVAHWRLKPEFWDKNVRIHLPGLNPQGTMIYPPSPGELPMYELLLEDRCEKELFKEWVFTLTAKDQEKVRANIRLERF